MSISQQDLIDAAEDLVTIETVVNSDSAVTVTSRLGQPIKTLRKAIQTVGFKAEIVAWAPTTAYSDFQQLISESDVVYRLVKAHTSTATFADDLAAGNWAPVTLSLADISDAGVSTASGADETVEGSLNKRVITEETEATMVANMALSAGVTVVTLGQAAAGDGLGQTFKIVASGGDVTLANGNEALIVSKYKTATGVETGQTALDKRVVRVGSVAGLAGVVPTENTRYETGEFWPNTKTGFGSFEWDASRSKTDHNGGTVIDPDKLAQLGAIGVFGTYFTPAVSGTGVFVRDSEDVSIEVFGGYKETNISEPINAIYTASAVNALPREINLGPYDYDIDETIPEFINRFSMIGVPGKTQLNYVGAVSSVVLKGFSSSGLGTAISNTQIRGIILNLNFVSGVTGLLTGYQINNTTFDDLRVINVASDGIGIDITKQYYAYWGFVEIVNPQATKGGTGLRIRGDASDALSQVNALTFPKIEVRSFTDGILLDTTEQTLYTLDFDAVIEKCTNGIRCTGTLSVFRAKFWLHMEGNTNNVVWGSPTDLAVQAGLIEWGGYAASGDFLFSHGAHVSSIWTLATLNCYISNTARVDWLGNVTDNFPGTYPATAQPLIAFEKSRITVGQNPSEQLFSITRQNYAKVKATSYDHASGVDDDIDLTEFLRVTGSRTRARLELILVRDSDGSNRTFSGYVARRNNGVWALYQLSGDTFDATFTLSVDASGVLTHAGTLDGYSSLAVVPF